MESKVAVEGSLSIAYTDLPSKEAGAVTYLLVPGLLDLKSQYRYLAPLLHRDGAARVVCADLRGMGSSDVGFASYTPLDTGKDTVALVNHLGLSRCVLVGSSMAAASVLWAAAELPGVVIAVVLLGPFAWDHPTGIIMTALLKLLFIPCWAAANGAAFHKTLYKDHPPADLDAHVAALKKNLGEPGRSAAASGHVFGLKAPCAQRMEELRGSPLAVLAVYGTKDPDFPPEGGAGVQKEVDELLLRLPQAQVMLVEGAGHYPQTEQPQAVAQRILEFVAAASG